MYDFAVILCTYNPNVIPFQKVIDSISALKIPKKDSLEICIVDNNSDPHIDKSPIIQEFLKNNANAKIHYETKQGLSYARMAGVQKTTAPILIFFDDDNIPDPHYLLNIESLSKQYPNVAVWGPGKVSVIFEPGVNNWIYNFKWIFQERQNNEILFGRDEHWTSYYPPGTGQIVRRDVMLRYAELMHNNLISITDRQGTSLSSGGDAQIVYTAVKYGFDAGIAPSLTLIHKIDEKKTNIKYVKRLIYNIMYYGVLSNTEIFPNQKQYYKRYTDSYPQAIFKMTKIIGSVIKSKNSKKITIDLAFYLGRLLGSYKVVYNSQPSLLVYLVKLLKLN